MGSSASVVLLCSSVCVPWFVIASPLQMLQIESPNIVGDDKFAHAYDHAAYPAADSRERSAWYARPVPYSAEFAS